jgi:anti-sigma factor RsiW
MSAHTAGHLDEGTLAAYALGGLRRAEAAAHERHLRGCDACRGELAELVEVRQMLSIVPAPLVLEDPALAGGAAEPVAVVPGQASPRRWPVVAIAAAAVVGAVLMPVLVPDSSPPSGRPSAGTVVMAGLDVNTHVSATMRLRPAPTISTFTLRLSGVPAGGWSLRVVAELLDGSTVVVGRWLVPRHTAGTILEISGSVDVKISGLTGFQVVLPDGKVLVYLAMPTAHHPATPSP